MPVNLSIKNVPDELALRLKDRASKNHRSLQGELMAIIEASVLPNGVSSAAGPNDAYDRERFGLSTPADFAAILRNHREGNG